MHLTSAYGAALINKTYTNIFKMAWALTVGDWALNHPAVGMFMSRHEVQQVAKGMRHVAVPEMPRADYDALFRTVVCWCIRDDVLAQYKPHTVRGDAVQGGGALAMASLGMHFALQGPSLGVRPL